MLANIIFTAILEPKEQHTMFMYCYEKFNHITNQLSIATTADSNSSNQQTVTNATASHHESILALSTYLAACSSGIFKHNVLIAAAMAKKATVL